MKPIAVAVFVLALAARDAAEDDARTHGMIEVGEPVFCVAVSPDAGLLLASGPHNTVGVWDADSGEEVVRLAGHSDRVVAVAVCDLSQPPLRKPATRAPSVGRDRAFVVASGSYDRTARLWELVREAEEWTGREVAMLEGHENWVYSVAFSPDGRWVATGSFDGTARVWECGVANAHCARALLTPDSSPLRGQGIRGAHTVAGDPPPPPLPLLPKPDRGEWEVVCRHVLRGHDGPVTRVAFAPEGGTVATCGYDGTVRLWNAQSGEQVRVLEAGETFVTALAWLDAELLASGQADGIVQLWDAASAERLQTVEAHEDAVWALACSADAAWLASASADATARMWHIERDAPGRPSLRRESVLDGHSGRVAGVAFLPSPAREPDANRLATASWDGTVRLWER